MIRCIIDGLLAALLLLNGHHAAHTAHAAPQRANRGVPRSTHVVANRAPCGGWRELVARYDWPIDTACRILVCESGGRADARNRHSTATGLFQILGGPTDPEANVAQAYRMWQARGWQPWECA